MRAGARQRYLFPVVCSTVVVAIAAVLLATRLALPVEGPRDDALWYLAVTCCVLIAGFAAISYAVVRRLERSGNAQRTRELRYDAIVRQLDDSVVLADASSGAIIEANPATLRRLGYAPHEIARLTIDDVFVDLPSSWDGRQHSQDSIAGASECRLRGKDGRLLDAEVTFSALALGGQAIACFVARDVSARKQAERQLGESQRQLAHLAHHDTLTNLPNRVHLQMRLPKLIATAAETGSKLALLYIDVDNFKNVNDSRGHRTGDEMLKAIAQRLVTNVAAQDVVVRMGGDEFIVVATQLRDGAGAAAVAGRLSSLLSTPLEVAGRRESITVSMGISVYPDDGHDAEVLLKHADIALYQAKDNGRANFRFFTPEMNAKLSERVALEQALRHALGTDQLLLEYQPIVAVQTGQTVGLEALLRWRHPSLGLVPPSRFIPVAEQCGVIIEIGEHVLRLVCKQLQQWRRDDVPVVPVAINISPKHFERGRLSETVIATTAEFGIDATLLNFEITESAVMQNTEQHVASLRALRGLGARVSIDDFGTGYSSLSYLKHLPIDALKIDRAFVRDMATDPNDAAIVSAIVGMARTLGLSTVAEGVETQEQLRRLRELGCERAQGFYFSRPMAAAQCAALLRQLAHAPRNSETSRLRILKLVGERSGAG